MTIINEIQVYDDLIGPRWWLQWILYSAVVSLPIAVFWGVGMPLGLIIVLAGLMIFMVGLPLTICCLFWGPKKMLPRTVTLLPGALVVASGQNRGTVELRHCYWYIGWTVEENPFFEVRRCVVIVIPPRKRIAVGLSEDAMMRWRNELATSSATRMPDSDRTLQDIGRAGGSVLVGAMLAMMVGVALQRLLPRGAWTVLDTFCLGAGGAFSGLALASVARFPYIGQARVYWSSLALYGIMGLTSGVFSGRNLTDSMLTMFLFQVIGISIPVLALWRQRRRDISKGKEQ